MIRNIYITCKQITWKLYWIRTSWHWNTNFLCFIVKVYLNHCYMLWHFRFCCLIIWQSCITVNVYVLFPATLQCCGAMFQYIDLHFVQATCKFNWNLLKEVAKFCLTSDKFYTVLLSQVKVFIFHVLPVTENITPLPHHRGTKINSNYFLPLFHFTCITIYS